MVTKLLLPFLLGITIAVSGATFYKQTQDSDAVLGGGTGTLNQLEQWKATSSPYAAITTNVAGKNLYIPSSTATASALYATTFCINNSAPDCITAWPTGSGGGASSTIVKLGGVISNAGTPTLDFVGGLDITETPTDEFNIIGLAANSVSSTTLLDANFTTGYVLQASTTATGGLSWVATSSLGISGGAGTPGGSDGYVQYNNGGVFGGEAELYWNDSTNQLGIGTTTPLENLHVYGTAASQYTTVRIDNGLVQSQFGASALDNTGYFGMKSNHPILLSTNNTGRLFVEADGSINVTSNDFNFSEGGTSDSNYNFTQTADDILEVNRSGGDNETFSIFNLKAPLADPQESTFTTMLDYGSNNLEFVDWTIENYGVDHFASINIAKRGTGQLLPFVIRHWNRDLGPVHSNGVPLAWFDPAGVIALGNYSSTTYDRTVGLQYSSSTVPTLFELEAGVGTSRFSVASNGNVTIAGDATVADEVYGVGWNGSVEVPTKNAVYDIIQAPSSIITAGDGLTWSSNTLNFDGGDTPGGVLGGTWATPTLDDSTITEPKLDADNAPGDTDYLQYDSTGTNFVWRTLAQVVADLEAEIETALDTLTSLVSVAVSTTLAVPFGTACDSNADGEICQDTTDNQLIVDGAVIPTTNVKLWSVTVASTSPAFIAGSLLAVPTHIDGYTITRIQCHVTGGTSKVIAVEDASANSSEDVTCATTNTTDDGTITNATYTASELSLIDFGATSGAVDYVSISAFGSITRE